MNRGCRSPERCGGTAALPGVTLTATSCSRGGSTFRQPPISVESRTVPVTTKGPSSPTGRRRPTLRSLAARPLRAVAGPVHPHRRRQQESGEPKPADTGAGGGRSSVVDNAAYVDGDRVASLESLAETYELLQTEPESMA